MTWTLRGQRFPTSPKFHSFRSVAGHFETSALNEHIITVYPCHPEFHSVSLYGQPFSSYRPFTGIWDKCTKWPQNDIKTLKGQRYSIYILQLPPSSKYQSALPYRPFCENCIKWHQMTLNIKRSKVPHMHITTAPKSQITPFHSTASGFRAIGHFVHQMTPNDLEHEMSKVPQLLLTSWETPLPPPQVPTFTHSVLLYGQPFMSYRPFWDKCTKWP